MPLKLRSRADGWIILALIACIWLVYAQVARFDFVNYDDNLYVTQCAQTQAGLTWNSIRWAFTTGATGNWHPLTWLSHMADVTLFGLNPGPHHLENVALHTANSVLLFLLLRDLTGDLWPSAAAAALFALHPLHVESVAWVAERKDVLSTLFGLLTLRAYGRYQRQPAKGTWAAMLGWFALALLTKPMVVTLPLLMLLLDDWPFGRLDGHPSRLRRYGELALEKWPLFALAAASCLVTFLVQRANGNVVTLAAIPVPARAANALLSYVRYLGMLVWPVGLAPFYPYPPLPYLYLKGLLSGALLLGLTAAIQARSLRHPYLRVGWYWYLLSLLPVIGLVQAGSQALADRYTYLPYIGLFIALAWGAAALAPGRRALLAWLAGGALALAMVLTAFQVSLWRDSIPLFRHTLRVTSNNLTARCNLGSALEKKERFEEAVPEYQAAIRISPKFHRAHYGLARSYQRLHQRELALAEYRQAFSLKEDDFQSMYMIGHILVQLGRGPEAAPYFTNFLVKEPARLRQGVAVKLEKELSQVARMNLGVIFRDLGQWDEAVFYFLEATGRDPRNAEACIQLGRTLAHQGRLAESLAVQRQGLAADPDNADRHRNLAETLRQAGQAREADLEFRRALELQPAPAGLSRP